MGRPIRALDRPEEFCPAPPRTLVPLRVRHFQRRAYAVTMDPEKFKASRWTSGNHLFPTVIEVTDKAVIRHKRSWFSRDQNRPALVGYPGGIQRRNRSPGQSRSPQGRCPAHPGISGIGPGHQRRNRQVISHLPAAIKPENRDPKPEIRKKPEIRNGFSAALKKCG